jgi:tRNA dimethylallyltransferase
MKKLLSIVGPTSVGKTAFGMWLAEQLVAAQVVEGVDVISADSRQVYKGLEILSGVDTPPAKTSSFLRLFGTSLIKPDEEWSVAHFQSYAQQIIDQSLAEKRLPILIGGTGLYHEHLFNDEDTLRVPPNPELRARLEGLSLSELQASLVALDQEKFDRLNHSDVNNPRRLIRAIEVSQAQAEVQPLRPSTVHPLAAFFTKLPQLSLGLRDEPALILQRIQQRVLDRFANGAQAEVEALIKTYPDWSLPAFSATGVQEIRAYLEGKISAEECMDHWTLTEFQYAKRQLTWWKKRSGILWYEIGEPKWETEALQAVLTFLTS